jgi:hypothetical protein
MNCQHNNPLQLHSEPAGRTSGDSKSGAGDEAGRIWHRPIITLIDIKKTMLLGGSSHDGAAHSIL